jgi:hypothetical protein
MAQSGLNTMSTCLSAFGAKRTCGGSGWRIDRSRMTRSGHGPDCNPAVQRPPVITAGSRGLRCRHSPRACGPRPCCRPPRRRLVVRRRIAAVGCVIAVAAPVVVVIEAVTKARREMPAAEMPFVAEVAAGLGEVVTRNAASESSATTADKAKAADAGPAKAGDVGPPKPPLCPAPPKPPMRAPPNAPPI